MGDKPILALMYDFDRTLSPRDMQEYAFIPGLGMNPGDFWTECNAVMREHGMDSILAYMLVMLEKSKGKQLVTYDTLRELGTSVKLFPGVKTWFHRVNTYAEKKGLQAEHYIISSGLKEIIAGTPIASEFKEIYAASFCYDGNGVPFWPAMAVNYTSKTQFLFRINKGVLDVTENKGLNEFMPENRRRVPFRNMIYIGDGLTDVPCMKLTKTNGGHSIAVYQENKREADDMILNSRVDFVVKADYSKGSEMECTVFEVIDKVAAAAKVARHHMNHYDEALVGTARIERSK
jgi:2-hydroxy-3-keto-5-methylthiopentenyl-1-phosphate phosphatase